MTKNRREFLAQVGATAGLAALPWGFTARAPSTSRTSPETSEEVGEWLSRIPNPIGANGRVRVVYWEKADFEDVKFGKRPPLSIAQWNYADTDIESLVEQWRLTSEEFPAYVQGLGIRVGKGDQGDTVRRPEWWAHSTEEFKQAFVKEQRPERAISTLLVWMESQDEGDDAELRRYLEGEW